MMKALFQDIFLYIPLHQLTFLTPLPKEKVYYETVLTTIPDHWFESPTLLLLDSDEECLKLNNKKYVNQLIQDSNLIGILICDPHDILNQDDGLSLLCECKVPIVSVEGTLSRSIFQPNKQQHYFSMLSMELNGYMNKGFLSIATNLSIALDTPFLFIDENNQLLWQIGSQIEIEKALHWITNPMSDNRKTNNSPLLLSDQHPVMETERLFEPYLMNIAGQVHLTLVAYANLTDWQRLIMDKFIGLTALFFQTDEMIRGQQEIIKEHFIYDLLYHKFESKKVMVKQGKTWGWNLEKPHHLFVIDVALSDESMINLEWMDEMIVYLETQRSYLNNQMILFPFQDQIIVLLQDDENRTPSKRKNVVFEMASLIEKELSSHWSGYQFHIGIGKWYQDSVNLNKSYQEAKMALQFGQVWFENNHVFHINDLGIFYLIIHLHKEILYDFCQEYLTSLIESDEKQGTEYLKTLKTYFQHRGIITEVSDTLYIHPNTLRNRLKKIEEISGVNLQNTTEFLNLMVAVKIHYAMSF